MINPLSVGTRGLLPGYGMDTLAIGVHGFLSAYRPFPPEPPEPPEPEPTPPPLIGDSWTAPWYPVLDKKNMKIARDDDELALMIAIFLMQNGI